jgi:hypothetical protein
LSRKVQLAFIEEEDYVEKANYDPGSFRGTGGIPGRLPAICINGATAHTDRNR